MLFNNALLNESVAVLNNFELHFTFCTNRTNFVQSSKSDFDTILNCSLIVIREDTKCQNKSFSLMLTCCTTRCNQTMKNHTMVSDHWPP